MKAIDEVKSKWDGTKKDETGRPCPFVGVHSIAGFKLNYFCSLVEDYGNFGEPCTFKDFNNCPLFPHKEQRNG